MRRSLIVGVLGVLTLSVMPARVFTQVQELDRATSEKTEDRQQTKQCVSLVIDYGNHFEKHYSELEWREDLTVLDTMQLACAHAYPLKFSFRGEGDTAFLTSIDGQENEGGNGSNWIYYVNAQRGDRSFAAKALQPDDAVLWKFEE